MQHLQFVNIIQILLIFQSLCFCVFLLTQKRGKLISNQLLATFLGVLSLQMGLNYLFETKSQIVLVDITPSLGFLYPPTLFLFISSLVYRSFRFSIKTIVHLVPWFAAVLLISITDNFVELLGLGIFSSLIIYTTLSFISIYKYQKVILHTQSKYTNISLNWIQNLLYLITGITVLESIRNFYLFESSIVENLFYTVLLISLLTFVLTLIYRGLKQPELFNGISKEDEEIAASFKGNIPLEKNQIEEFANKIQTRLKYHRDFLNPDLDLQELANNLNVSTRILSQVINAYFNKNFSEYINHFRIAEAKLQLEASKQTGKSVLEIVYASGFNSKSNFYTAFKQVTGITPSNYKVQIQKKQLLK